MKLNEVFNVKQSALKQVLISLKNAEEKLTVVDIKSRAMDYYVEGHGMTDMEANIAANTFISYYKKYGTLTNLYFNHEDQLDIVTYIVTGN